MTTSTALDSLFQSIREYLDVAVAKADDCGNLEAGSDLVLDAVEQSLNPTASKIDKWDVTAIQRLKNCLYQDRGLPGVIDSDDEEPANGSTPQLSQQMIRPNRCQRQLGRLPSSISIISSSPPSPSDQEECLPKSILAIRYRSPTIREGYLSPHDKRSSQLLSAHNRAHSGRLFIDDLLSDEVVSDDPACLDDKSVVSENDESLVQLLHFGPSSIVARSESIIDDETHFTDDVLVASDAYGNRGADTKSHASIRIVKRLGRCSSSIIDSASDGEDDSRNLAGRPGVRERGMLKEVASSRSSENRHTSMATTAILGIGAPNQKTFSNARNASPHHWMLPVFANLSLNRQLDKDTTCPIITGGREESRKSSESIISESSMSGIIDD